MKETIELPELPKFGLPNLDIDFKGTLAEIREFSFFGRTRTWKEVLTGFFLGLVLFNFASYDVVSDSLVANSFLGGTNYTYRVHNLNDLSHHVDNSNCIITRDLQYHVNETNNLIIYTSKNGEIIYGKSRVKIFCPKDQSSSPVLLEI